VSARTLLCYLLLTLLSLPAQAAPTEPGTIRVLKVQGSVALVRESDNTRSDLAEGALIGQGQRIETGAKSSAILLFSNGTTITVEQSSNLSVDAFLQDPFDAENVDFSKIKREPTNSITKIRVGEGSIVGNVAKVNKGSSFDVTTPVGVAGIRGTIFRIAISRSGQNFVLNISLPEGSVVFDSNNGQSLTLQDGTAVTISAPENNLGSPVTQPVQALPPAEAAAILSQVAEALGVVVPQPFGPSPQATGTQQENQTENTGNQGTSNAGQQLPPSGTGGGSGTGSPSAPNPRQVPPAS